jgi:hypothetical protein
VTFVIAIPSTLATVFGISKINEVLSLELMTAALVLSTTGALLLVILPGSMLSFSSLEKRLRRVSRNK